MTIWNAIPSRKSKTKNKAWDLISTTLPVGYTASKVRWVMKQEPETYAKMGHVLLPHDYLNYWLTGEIVMEE
ncbi:MAG: hypothetical protein JO151_16445 [Verrucomicrobia bacterium]|nr:hypothetical protein [Verrucomicrobiota bacterium]